MDEQELRESFGVSLEVWEAMSGNEKMLMAGEHAQTELRGVLASAREEWDELPPNERAAMGKVAQALEQIDLGCERLRTAIAVERKEMRELHEGGD